MPVREKCLCGQVPRFGCHRAGEDVVISSYSCGIKHLSHNPAFQIGCGYAGPEIEDAYSDEPAAALSWDAEIRKLKEQSHD